VKVLVLSVLCAGLTLGVCLAVRRLLDRIAASSRPARRSAPAARPAVLAPEQIIQQSIRYRTSEGKEAIRGMLIADFAAGQRDAALYVAFCPPFERLPDVEAHVADDAAATVKVAQRLHHGAQLDVRLPAPAEAPLSVTIEFFAEEREPTHNPRPALAV
jgi:hypothetical protein